MAFENGKKDFNAQVSKTQKFHPYQFPIIINNNTNTNTNHRPCHFKTAIEVIYFKRFS
jgi:hypothetical protein